MAIELKHVRDDELNGGVMGSVFIDGTFVCHEFGSDADTKLKAILEKS